MFIRRGKSNKNCKHLVCQYPDFIKKKVFLRTNSKVIQGKALLKLKHWEASGFTDWNKLNNTISLVLFFQRPRHFNIFYNSHIIALIFFSHT